MQKNKKLHSTLLETVTNNNESAFLDQDQILYLEKLKNNNKIKKKDLLARISLINKSLKLKLEYFFVIMSFYLFYLLFQCAS